MVQKLYHWPPDETSTIAFSWPDFEALKARQTTFDKVAAWARFSHAMALPTGSMTFQGELVDGDYFDLLRVSPLLGRLLQPADDDASAPPVLVIGEQFWRSAFAADPDVVGRSVTIGGNQSSSVWCCWWCAPISPTSCWRAAPAGDRRWPCGSRLARHARA